MRKKSEKTKVRVKYSANSTEIEENEQYFDVKKSSKAHKSRKSDINVPDAKGVNQKSKTKCRSKNVSKNKQNGSISKKNSQRIDNEDLDHGFSEAENLASDNESHSSSLQSETSITDEFSRCESDLDLSDLNNDECVDDDVEDNLPIHLNKSVYGDCPNLELPQSSCDLLLGSNDSKHILRAVIIYEVFRRFFRLIRLSPFIFEDFCAALASPAHSNLLTESYFSLIKFLIRSDELNGITFGPSEARDSLHSKLFFMDNVTWPASLRAYLESDPSFKSALEKLENPDSTDFPLHPFSEDLSYTSSFQDIEEGDVSHQDVVNERIDCRLKVFEHLVDNFIQTPASRNLMNGEGGTFLNQSEDHCRVCFQLGQMIMCDTCPAVYHLDCISLTFVPDDEWRCENCVSHDVAGVKNCYPLDKNTDLSSLGDKTSSGIFCRQECIGLDRHGNRYWFICRRLIVETFNNNETLYYSTYEQLQEVMNSLDGEFFEKDLFETIDGLKSEMERQMRITCRLTITRKPISKKSYFEVENAEILRIQKLKVTEKTNSVTDDKERKLMEDVQDMLSKSSSDNSTGDRSAPLTRYRQQEISSGTFHYKLGQEGNFKFYINRFTTHPSTSLSKVQQNEERHKKQNMSNKFSLTDTCPFKWLNLSRELNYRVEIFQSVINTILMLESNIPTYFMHVNWPNCIRKSWISVVESAKTSVDLSRSLIVLASCIRPSVFLPVWTDSFGHVKAVRIAAVDEKKKTLEKKREKMDKDEETERLRPFSRWVKYTLGLKHQVSKQKGEEYRYHGQNGWLWTSKFRKQRFSSPSSSSDQHPFGSREKAPPKGLLGGPEKVSVIRNNLNDGTSQPVFVSPNIYNTVVDFESHDEVFTTSTKSCNGDNESKTSTFSFQSRKVEFNKDVVDVCQGLGSTPRGQCGTFIKLGRLSYGPLDKLLQQRLRLKKEEEESIKSIILEKGGDVSRAVVLHSRHENKAQTMVQSLSTSDHLSKQLSYSRLHYERLNLLQEMRTDSEKLDGERRTMEIHVMEGLVKLNELLTRLKCLNENESPVVRESTSTLIYLCYSPTCFTRVDSKDVDSKSKCYSVTCRERVNTPSPPSPLSSSPNNIMSQIDFNVDLKAEIISTCSNIESEVNSIPSLRSSTLTLLSNDITHNNDKRNFTRALEKVVDELTEFGDDFKHKSIGRCALLKTEIEKIRSEIEDAIEAASKIGLSLLSEQEVKEKMIKNNEDEIDEKTIREVESVDEEKFGFKRVYSSMITSKRLSLTMKTIKKDGKEEINKKSKIIAYPIASNFKSKHPHTSPLSIFNLSKHQLRKLARTGGKRHNPDGFIYNHKQAQTPAPLWPYPSPRPAFKTAWFYHVNACQKSLFNVALHVRILWAVIRWDELNAKLDHASIMESSFANVNTVSIGSSPSASASHFGDANPSIPLQQLFLDVRHVGQFMERTEYLVEMTQEDVRSGAGGGSGAMDQIDEGSLYMDHGGLAATGNHDYLKSASDVGQMYPTPTRVSARKRKGRNTLDGEPSKVSKRLTTVKRWVPEHKFSIAEIRSHYEKIERDLNAPMTRTRTGTVIKEPARLQDSMVMTSSFDPQKEMYDNINSGKNFTHTNVNNEMNDHSSLSRSSESDPNQQQNTRRTSSSSFYSSPSDATRIENARKLKSNAFKRVTESRRCDTFASHLSQQSQQAQLTNSSAVPPPTPPINQGIMMQSTVICQSGQQTSTTANTASNSSSGAARSAGGHEGPKLRAVPVPEGTTVPPGTPTFMQNNRLYYIEIPPELRKQQQLNKQKVEPMPTNNPLTTTVIPPVGRQGSAVAASTSTSSDTKPTMISDGFEYAPNLTSSSPSKSASSSQIMNQQQQFTDNAINSGSTDVNTVGNNIRNVVIRDIGSCTIYLKDGQFVVSGPDTSSATEIAHLLATGQYKIGSVGGRQVLVEDSTPGPLIMETPVQVPSHIPTEVQAQLVQTPQGPRIALHNCELLPAEDLLSMQKQVMSHMLQIQARAQALNQVPPTKVTIQLPEDTRMKMAMAEQGIIKAEGGNGEDLNSQQQFQHVNNSLSQPQQVVNDNPAMLTNNPDNTREVFKNNEGNAHHNHVGYVGLNHTGSANASSAVIQRAQESNLSNPSQSHLKNQSHSLMNINSGEMDKLKKRKHQLRSRLVTMMNRCTESIKRDVVDMRAIAKRELQSSVEQKVREMKREELSRLRGPSTTNNVAVQQSADSKSHHETLTTVAGKDYTSSGSIGGHSSSSRKRKREKSSATNAAVSESSDSPTHTSPSKSSGTAESKKKKRKKKMEQQLPDVNSASTIHTSGSTSAKAAVASGIVKKDKLYCICKSKYDPSKFYVGCDVCSNWFHGKCIGINQEASKSMTEYICKDCQIAKNGEETYCICKQPYDETQFYVGCESCGGWYHGKCVGLLQVEAESIDEYLCVSCDPNSKMNKANNKPWNNKDDAELVKKLVKQLMMNKNSYSFKNPVDVNAVPNYYKVIKEPMDLSTVESRTCNGHYTKLSQLIGDVMRIFENCRYFNLPNTPIVKAASGLEHFFASKLQVVRNKFLASM